MYKNNLEATRLDKHIYGLFAKIMLKSLSDSRQAMTKSTASEAFRTLVGVAIKYGDGFFAVCRFKCHYNV